MKGKKRKCRGSFTLEAAYIFSILVLLMGFILGLGIRLCENMQTESEDIQVLEELKTEEYFLKMVEGKAFLEQLLP